MPYRADTHQLIRAGLAGGKGKPESVATHPCVFATFTAPPSAPSAPGSSLRAGRPRCRVLRLRRLGGVDRPRSELWRRTIIGIRRLDKLAKPHDARVRLSFAKVDEFQRRGLIHFHAIFGLDGTDPAHPERTVAPPPAITADVRASVIGSAAATVWFAAVAHQAKPKGWDITWGTQVDPRVVKLTDDGEITDIAVASYLAKYATKSTEPVGIPPGRITAENARHYASPRTHQRRLIAACLKLGNHPTRTSARCTAGRTCSATAAIESQQEPPLLASPWESSVEA